MPSFAPSRLADQIRTLTGADRVLLGDRVQPLWGGYGELRRAQLLGSRARHVVVKQVAPPPEAELARDAKSLRSHRRKLRSYAVELAFYQGFARDCDEHCRVPALIQGSRVGDGVVFVLEDLDSAGFSSRARHGTEQEIRTALAWLAAFHARFLGVAPDGLWRVGTYWHLATRPDELAVLGAHPLRRAAASIDQRLSDARHRTLVHGDAKLANFCFSAAGDAAAAVDFQYAGGGVGVKDVAYLLYGCVDSRACTKHVPRYLDVYFTALASECARRRGPAVNVPELEREWRDLFPLAWVDFHRFLLGWAPREAEHPYSEALTQRTLLALG